ncbi:hypothetical protein JI58_08750 [Marinosulfonomonas sp. PRT-SC04]|nr:hypothetical protein JI58_08750 [Marinosulfonomonas sp. PRT-SC04]
MQNPSNPIKIGALKIENVLPEHVILPPIPPGFTDRFDETGAVWMCAEPSLLLENDDPEISPDWQARCGGVTAVSAKPNTGHTQTAIVAGISGLGFHARVNSGYCIPEAMFRNGPFSLALIYAPLPENEPRSLVTINPANFDNYVFLSERDGVVELTDQQASFSLQQPVSPDCEGFRLVIFSRTEDGYTLAIDGNPPVHGTSVPESPNEDGPLLDTSGLCDLFIGCRSHRKGILKTLGEMVLADVFLWPDKDILADEQGASPPNDASDTRPEYDLLLKYYTEVICRDV